MPLFVFPPDPNAPSTWPGHAVFFGKPICQEAEGQIGRGITRSFDLAEIACPDFGVRRD
jgi:hypothetical protein